MRRIGILGGTFDPPHNGHLLIAEQVRTNFGLDQIWFMPANIPPHKQKTSTSNQARADMLKLATSSNDFFEVELGELHREGISYTVDTMHILQQQHPQEAFYFIIGADMIENLPYWHHIDELFQIVDFIGVQRPGASVKTDYPIELVDVPAFGVSSSLIRERIRQRQSVKYLLPDAVIDYIREHHLYED